MTITIVIINPRKEMGLECGWRHAQKRWAENLEDFEKESVEFRPWCWEIGVRPWCWEIGVRPWCWEIGVRPSCWEIGVRPSCWEIEIGPCRQTTEILPLGAENWVLCHRVEFSTVATVKSFGSRPAKMNWDLKHYKMCQTLRVLLA